MCLQVRTSENMLSPAHLMFSFVSPVLPAASEPPQLATVGLMLVPLLICPANNVKLTAREGAGAVAALHRAACLWYCREVGTLHCLLHRSCELLWKLPACSHTQPYCPSPPGSPALPLPLQDGPNGIPWLAKY